MLSGAPILGQGNLRDGGVYAGQRGTRKPCVAPQEYGRAKQLPCGRGKFAKNVRNGWDGPGDDDGVPSSSCLQA